MQKQLLTIAIVGIIIIAAVTAGGYYLGKVIQKPKATPADTSLLTAEPTATPAPSATPAPTGSNLLPTAPPHAGTTVKQQVKGTTTTKTETPVTAKTGLTETKQISIRFVGVPMQVKANQPFVVSWFIDGPDGMMGANTRLSTSLNGSSSTGSSSSSVSSSQSSAFGAFQIPQKFQSNVTFSGNTGSILLKATAEVNGQTYTATQTVQLTN